ncbi:uncharacterized protein [Rutidosis leptorrhynchoides]|uniref:uncharacterized protein n=1 Tax=Rutidosis leptorrhynchoides TaxID=125765 RepID=UPI003A99C7A6
MKEKPSFVALQEIKIHTVNDSWIRNLWGSTDCDFIQQEMVGKSGGQLLIWDTKLFEAVNIIKFDRVIGIKGKWRSNGIEINILNVYGPHDDVKKQRLWDSLTRLLADSDEAWVLCGDFNEVRDETERFNCDFMANRARRFNDMIETNNLFDIPLGGRSFTRVSDDGIKFSKLDRFLVSNNFFILWDNLMAVALDRTESDYCPIVLKDDEKDYGPKPFKVFDVWLDEDGIYKVVTEAWGKVSISGPRKDRIFMNNLKSVKNSLKEWSKEKFGKLDNDIEVHKSLAQALELKAETGNLNAEELEAWKNARKEWLNKEKIRSGMLKQKARVRWTLEGDENTKYFHSII